MADNYLEKKMEEHQRMMASAGVRTVRRPASASAALRFDPLRIVVAVKDAALCEAVVRQMRRAGHQVAFAMTDVRRGNLLAQESGARCYPLAPEKTDAVERIISDLRATRGEPDMLVASADVATVAIKTVIITADKTDACSRMAIGVNVIFMPDGAEASAADAAAMALMLTHRSSRRLDGMMFTV